MALTVAIVRIDRMQRDHDFDAHHDPRVPLPVLLDASGRGLGKLPEDLPGALQMTFEDWRGGMPARIGQYEAFETALPPHTLAAQIWDATTHHFRQLPDGAQATCTSVGHSSEPGSNRQAVAALDCLNVKGAVTMTDTSVTKVEATQAPKGPQGQRYLASGHALSMRLWDKVPPNNDDAPVRREYETIGYVISGRAMLTLEGQTVPLQAGTSWVVPKGAQHSYKIEEAFTAVEATHPAAEMHDRDAV